jgi:hypothetical protein
MLIALLAFVTGALGGYYVELKTDEYRDGKLNRLEELMMDDNSADYYFHTDAYGQVWALRPGVCIRVH